MSGGSSTPREASYFTILTYGYPDGERLMLEEIISEKWKIKHKAAAGCSINRKLWRKIEAENRKTYAAIEKKYGKDWKIRYEEELVRQL